MNPDMQLLLMLAIVAALFIVALFHQIRKGEEEAKKANRKVAEDAVKGMITEIQWPNRHRWVTGPNGEEMIQFIYLLLGRHCSRSETGHIVWAEITLWKHKVEVKLFHTSEISPSDSYVEGTVDALRKQGWTVSVVETSGQPNLEHTGVRASEVIT